MVRRLTHVPDCEGSIPTGYSFLGIIFKFIYFLSYDHILFLVYSNFDG